MTWKQLARDEFDKADNAGRLEHLSDEDVERLSDNLAQLLEATARRYVQTSAEAA